MYRWLATASATIVLAAVAAACGSTGGEGGNQGKPDSQFVLSNGSNRGSLVVNVNPNEVDANKSDRLGVVATLADVTGAPISGVTIRFTADIDDIRFIGMNFATEDGPIESIGFATTDVYGNADIIAVVGSTPTATGDFLGTGMIFAQAPPAFFLGAGFAVKLTDVGFVDSDVLSVIPAEITLVEPTIGAVTFFNLVGGTPPYTLSNEASGAGVATLGQHCAPGCTENTGVGLCIGSPCQSDEDCNLDGSPIPADVCVGAIKRCLASCAGSNCAGSRCDTDDDCNDGLPTPANVCADSGQSLLYTVLGDAFSGTHGFTVQDAAGNSVPVSVTFEFTCGNGVRRGAEQCDLSDGLGDLTCIDLGFPFGGALICDDECQFDVSNCLTDDPMGM